MAVIFSKITSGFQKEKAKKCLGRDESLKYRGWTASCHGELPHSVGRSCAANTHCLLSCLSSYDLQRTPSWHQGVASALEWDVRALGCELIQSSGILLKLNQVRSS